MVRVSAVAKRSEYQAGNSLNSCCKEGGFTLLEMLTVVVIIALLVSMLIPVVRGMQSKAARLSCAGNLKSLYVAANAYTIDNQHWPQIDAAVNSGQYAEEWVKALSAYSLKEKNWRCPTVERLMGNPSKRDPKDRRIDYFASPFGRHSRAPFQWSTQPWFIERSDCHGNGNLMIFSDGTVRALGEIVRKKG